MTRIAEKFARKVNNRKQRHACLILEHGRLIASYNNRNGHAEQIAITKTLVNWTLKRATLISFRIKPNGEIGNSKPCVHCEEAIKYAKIRKVIYFDGKEWVEEVR